MMVSLPGRGGGGGGDCGIGEEVGGASSTTGGTGDVASFGVAMAAAGADFPSAAPTEEHLFINTILQ